jgi:transposase-like protein
MSEIYGPSIRGLKRRWNKCMVKIEGKRMINRIISYGGLNELKVMGYIPKVILTDGDKCYPDAIKEVFKNAIHQLCIFHVKQNIYEAFEQEKNI